MKNSLFLAISLALVVASPSAFARKKNNNEVVQQQQTQAYVDAKMHETLSSIDRSLSTLVSVTRGGEPARIAGPIADTVAGAAGEQRPAMRPDALPSKVVNQAVLDSKVTIQWDGSAHLLLADISKQIDFRFDGGSHPVSKRIKIESNGLPLREVLSLIASQIEGQADIHVSMQDRSIRLVRH